jgi:UDP-N-acetylglucosamine:LPS N-acetylglucosamine transferase
VVLDSELTARSAADAIERCWSDPGTLAGMSQAATSLGKADAAQLVADLMIAVAR